MITALSHIAIPPTNTILAQNDIEPRQAQPGQTRTFYYYSDQTIKSIVTKFPDGHEETKNFDTSGILQDKQYDDGRSVTYEFGEQNNQKFVIETRMPQNIKIKRVFNDKNQVIASVYPDHREDYTYILNDKTGEIDKIIIKRDDGTQRETITDDKDLSFLSDYDTVGSEKISLMQDMHERQYLYNPTRFRDNHIRPNQYRKIHGINR